MELDQGVAQVLAMCREGAPIELVRSQLMLAIAHHPRCIHPEVEGSRELLQELFRYAAFEIPPALPNVVTLYRGVSGIDGERGAEGYFWTNDRWFAIAFALTRAWQRELHRPILIEAHVDRCRLAAMTAMNGSVALSSVQRSEVADDLETFEFIVLDPPGRVNAAAVSLEDVEHVAALHFKYFRSQVEEGNYCPEKVELWIGRINTWLTQFRESNQPAMAQCT